MFSYTSLFNLANCGGSDSKKPNPRWCPDGLTKSQKRRVQRLCQLEQHKEAEIHVLDKKKVWSKVWRPKPKDDDGKDDKPQADINSVIFLPKEFMAPVDSDVSDEELGMAELTLEPRQAIFEKPEDEKRQHLKALFLKGFVNGKPVTKMLVDGGDAVNLMPYTMLRKIGKFDEDLDPNRHDVGGLRRQCLSSSRSNMCRDHHQQ
jgi:hypothetical protein